jgi:hypothetical protein
MARVIAAVFIITQLFVLHACSTLYLLVRRLEGTFSAVWNQFLACITFTCIFVAVVSVLAAYATERQESIVADKTISKSCRTSNTTCIRIIIDSPVLASCAYYLICRKIALDTVRINEFTCEAGVISLIDDKRINTAIANDISIVVDEGAVGAVGDSSGAGYTCVVVQVK